MRLADKYSLPRRELLARWNAGELAELMALFEIEREEMRRDDLSSEAVSGLEQMKAQRRAQRHR